MGELLHQCITKATIAEGNQLKHGPNWIFARRAFLKVYEDRLECGDWLIRYEDIKDATLLSVRMNLVIPGYVLQVATDERVHHFGLNAGSFWKSELPFALTRAKGRLGYSLFSLTLRAILVGYLLYWLWQRTR
ncbi:MAG TPA: hypothetical protein DD670_18455 [Planctomycetaceae bacterium]|nr:hypothetical protein [Planctomycetaceae bacterium]